ncbi:hypothetical protein FNF29_01825 [Cafeteria roenbergensis]|uniref:Protein kinase domain-containing protein n=1 Tax=Cafeteria roenbergensis TaxID=33653 RepID=A0A5A8CUH5_CAFRO|nr:hypothetical protein FNF29_01825 [Cafeteria roenbergensis]|eukprot:KAA0155451.1 hypothetical protein FNF29_01825 [Cafeteria roenbergensis]
MADASASRPEAAAASDRELFRKRFKKSDKLEELEGSRDGKRIYRAVDKDTMFEVAWHELPLGKAEQVDDRAAEAPVPEHENLLKVVAKWEEPGPPKKLVVITEMVDAGTLQLHIERIKDDVRVNVVKKWCRQILSGLQHLHVTTGRLHGDVRLNNIFMNSVTGDVRLGYLDVEHTLGSASGGGTSSATAAYAAPEGVHGPPADIYSFGICLLHMVTGERPYWVEPSELATQTQQAKQSGQDPITLTKYRFDASAERIIRAPHSAHGGSHQPGHGGAASVGEARTPHDATTATDPGRPDAGGAASLDGTGQGQAPHLAPSGAGHDAPIGQRVLGPGSAAAAAASGGGTGEAGDQLSTAPPPIRQVGPPLPSVTADMADPAKPRQANPQLRVGQPGTPSASPAEAGSTAAVAGSVVGHTPRPPANERIGPAAPGATSDPTALAAAVATSGSAAAAGAAPQPAARPADVLADPSPPGPDPSLRRLKGITFEEFKLKRVSVSAHMTLFFKPPPGARGADDVIRYRTVAFTFNRDERNRIASLARELVDWRLIHPEDEAVATAWLDASLGRLAAAPYAYCRPLRASAQGTDPSGSMRRRRDARPRQDLGFDPSGAAQRTPAEQDQPALPPPARDTGAQQGTAPPAVPPAHAPAGDPMQPASAPRDRAGSIASTATGAPAANVLLQRQHSPDGAPAHASSAHGDASSAAERHLPGSAQDAGQADSDRRTA